MKTVCDSLRSMKGMLTAPQLAELLGFHPKYIYEISREGHLPSYQIRGAVRFDPHEIAVWLDQRRRGRLTQLTM